MNPWLRSLIGASFLALLSAAPAHAGPYSALYVFGDSLSDIGNDLAATGGVVPLSSLPGPYYQGRFTNGPNYADVLASGLGLSLTASATGGSDYAYGGARSDYMTYPFAVSFVDQVGGYAASAGTADPNALYVLWIGANDMSDVLTGTNPHGDAAASISNVLSDIGTSIATLAGMGAQHFLVPNLPDLGLIPEVLALGSPASAGATALTQAFNSNLDSLLAALTAGFPTLDIFAFDTYGAHHGLVNNPVLYGLTNVTEGCYPGVEDGTMPLGSSICATPENYLYWDHEHPSATTHAVLGNQMLGLVPEPAEWLLFTTGLGLMGWRARRQVNT